MHAYSQDLRDRVLGALERGERPSAIARRLEVSRVWVYQIRERYLHEFDALCQALGIEHRLTRPKSPQTNGMVERFNGRLEQVLRSHHFNSADDLQKTLHRFVWLYNQHLPQKALNHQTPVQALKRWQSSHPQLFSKEVRNHLGPDT